MINEKQRREGTGYPSVLHFGAILPWLVGLVLLGFLNGWWPRSDPFDGQYLVYHRWKGAPPFEFPVRPAIWWLVWICSRMLLGTIITTPLCAFLALLGAAFRTNWYVSLKRRPAMFLAFWFLGALSIAWMFCRILILPGAWWGWIYIEGWDGTIPPPGAKQLPP